LKQIVTVFRAEGTQANRVANLCRKTRKADLFALRDHFRHLARSGNQLTGYAEFLDPWSMFDSFDRAMGPTARCRNAVSGNVYWTAVTEEVLEEAKRNARKRHQFAEDARLQKCVADFMATPFLNESPDVIVLFREIVGGLVSDGEFADGSRDLIKYSR